MDAQQPHRGRDRPWWIYSCVIALILCLVLGSVLAGATSPALAPAESAQVQQESPSNTLTIRSTGDERVSYSITVSEQIEPGPEADLEDADQPDAVSEAAAVGSVAEGGVDSYTFSGQITRLTLSSDAANVSVNGEQVDPADYQDDSTTSTPTPTSSPTATATSTPTETASPTETPEPTDTPTEIQTPTESETATFSATATDRSTSTSTPTVAAPESVLETSTSTGGTATVSPTTATPQATASDDGSGILSWIASNLLALGGGLLLLVFLAAFLYERYNRKPRF